MNRCETEVQDVNSQQEFRGQENKSSPHDIDRVRVDVETQEIDDNSTRSSHEDDSTEIVQKTRELNNESEIPDFQSELERNALMFFDKVTKARKTSMRPKKADIIAIADRFMQDMMEARHLDELDRTNAPKIRKSNFLVRIERVTDSSEYLPAIIEKGFLNELSNWLRPVSVDNLPPVLVRSRLLQILRKIPCLHESSPVYLEQNVKRGKSDLTDEAWRGITPEILLSGGDIGSVVMFYANRTTESQENKAAAREICERWSSLLMKLSGEDVESESEDISTSRRPATPNASKKPLLVTQSEADHEDPAMLNRRRYQDIGPVPEIKHSGNHTLRHQPQVTLKSKAANSVSPSLKSSKRKKCMQAALD